MFEKLFVKTSDFVFHKIAPYAVERERFLEHCCEEGFSNGLDVDHIEMTCRQAAPEGYLLAILVFQLRR